MAKVGKYGSMEAVEETAAAPVQETATETTTTVQVNDEPTQVEIEDQGAGHQAAETAPAASSSEEQAAEETTNESSFDLGDWGEAPAAAGGEEGTQQQQQQQSWQDVIANVDAEELLRHLGLDEFTINLHKHLSNGGKAQDYIDARGRDWNSVSDMDIMRMEYAERYPNLTEEEVDRLLVKKYGEDDLDDDGQIELKADAYKARQKKIEDDKKFKIAERQAPQAQENNSAELEAQIQEQLHYFVNHEATKALNQSKRVAVDLGDGKSFNFNIDKPEVLTKVITDGAVWQKIMSNEKGEPDVAKLHQVALFAINPKKFVKDLVNYGKSLGHLREIEEGRNAVAQKGRPADSSQEKPSYSIGTYGSRR